MAIGMRFFDIVKLDLKANGLADKIHRVPMYVLMYPSFSAVFSFRVQSVCYNKGFALSVLSRFLRARSIRRGVDINPNAKIGAGLRLPHPIGVVIGSASIVGLNCTIYHNVTIGTNPGLTSSYPVVGNGCTIFSGALIVGQVEIEESSIVKAHSIVCE